MIDYIKAELGIPFLTADQRQNLLGHKSRAKLRPNHKVRIAIGMGEAHAFLGPNTVLLCFCPAKVLGHWNCFGSLDLPYIMRKCVPRLFKRMGVPYLDDVRREVEEGSYRLRELHIAFSFHLVNYEIAQFIRRLQAKLIDSHCPERARRGIGFSITKNRRNFEFYLYAKGGTMKKAVKKYSDKLSKTKGWSKVGVQADLERQLVAAYLGPRVELRLRDHFFRADSANKSELCIGRGWKEETAFNVFFDKLAGLELPDHVDLTVGRQKLDNLSSPAKSLFVHWSNGEPLEALVSKRTIARQRAEIREVMGVDILVPASAVEDDLHGIRLTELFRKDNVVTPDAIRDAYLEQEHMHLDLWPAE